MMVVMVRLIGLAKKVDERANEVKSRPAHIQPIEAGGHGLGHEKMQNQMCPGTHQQAGEGNKLEAVQGRGPVKFGEVHGISVMSG
jgi:hypothetical protein